MWREMCHNGPLELRRGGAWFVASACSLTRGQRVGKGGVTLAVALALPPAELNGFARFIARKLVISA